jgi:DNA-binding CsgD family transcriptional regulator
MQALTSDLDAGVWTLAEMSNGQLDPDYRQRFYQATGWQEEVGLILPIREGLTLMLFLGRLGQRHALRPSERARLEELFPLIHSLCRQHWQQPQPLLAESAETSAAGSEATSPDGATLKVAIARAMASVGGDLLTRRERQVAGLLLQGLDTEAIAAALGIGSGTVKNHRKHLYAKLRLGSRAELFGFFLNHLITTPGQGQMPAP